MLLQAEPSKRADAAGKPARKLISLGVNPSAQAAQWAARRTQKAPKATSATEVGQRSNSLKPWLLPYFVASLHLPVPLGGSYSFCIYLRQSGTLCELDDDGSVALSTHQLTDE